MNYEKSGRGLSAFKLMKRNRRDGQQTASNIEIQHIEKHFTMGDFRGEQQYTNEGPRKTRDI